MFEVLTEHPVALDSPDHLQPNGCIHDNSTDVPFCSLVEQHFKRHFQGRPLFCLDIGCAGGKLVLDWLTRGHHAIGLEGSDAPKVEQRWEWPHLGGSHLFTCDCSRPFQILFKGAPVRFDVVTAWEVCEHVPEDRLPTFLANIAGHLKKEGLFFASIPATDDPPWHQTVRSREWWDQIFLAHGLEVSQEGLAIVQKHRVRGEVDTAFSYRVSREKQ